MKDKIKTNWWVSDKKIDIKIMDDYVSIVDKWDILVEWKSLILPNKYLDLLSPYFLTHRFDYINANMEREEVYWKVKSIWYLRNNFIITLQNDKSK